jgi:hypothetical protein
MVDQLTVPRTHGNARIEVVPVEVVPTDLALQVEDYWRVCCRNAGQGVLPRRRDIDPVVLGRLLPQVFLLDIVGPAHRLRWRLVGSTIGAREGGDPTGRWVEDSLVPDQADLLRHFAEATVRERRPSCHAGRWRDSLNRSQPLVRLLVPLSDEGSVVSTLLGLIDYAPNEIIPLRGAA